MGRKTFYWLVRGAARTPLTRVDNLELPNAADVGALRKAVYNETKKCLPRDVDAVALIVSTTKEKDTRLGVGADLGDNGLSEADPFIVQVPQVWFQLVNARTGVPLIDMDVGWVPLTGENTILDLRDAVFVKVSSVLPSAVVDSNLKVCKSQQVGDIKVYLGVDERIEDHGKNKETALIVEVPVPCSEDSTPRGRVLGSRGVEELEVLVETLRTESPRKKAKREVEPQFIAYSEPIRSGDFSVSLESISAYGVIRDGFEMPGLPRPLHLLYGPRQFGKTSIAFGIQQWLGSCPNVKCVYVELQAHDVQVGHRFWKVLGIAIGANSACVDYTSFIQLINDVAAKEKTTICLILDEMDILFNNQELAQAFLSVLRALKSNSSFCGFLGVGSHDLVHHHQVFRGTKNMSPYNVAHLVQIKPFSKEQMEAFFTLIERRYHFPECLRQGIIKYSSGAPGVFGSIIRFTIDNSNWEVEWEEWEPWFKWKAFPEYLEKYNVTYARTREDLRGLDPLRWKALKCVLQLNGTLTPNEVEAQCGILHKDNEEKLVDKLLNMGIVVKGNELKLSIVSKVMHRVCCEAVPTREISDAVSTEDPLQLLAGALHHVSPAAISHDLARNRRSPGEAVFHFELYSTLRDALKQASLAPIAEARAPDSEEKADILVGTGAHVLFGYELKVDLLAASQIATAAARADAYRKRFSVKSMVVVNFVPGNHKLDQGEAMFRVKGHKDVSIVHVRFNSSCNEFHLLTHDAGGEIKDTTVKCLDDTVSSAHGD